MTDELMSVSQASREAKVTRKAIHDAIKVGKLKAVLVDNEFYVIYRSDFEVWQNARKRGRPPKSEG